MRRACLIALALCLSGCELVRAGALAPDCCCDEHHARHQHQGR